MLNFSLTAAVILYVIVGGLLSHSLSHQATATPQSPDKPQQQNKSQNRTKKNPTAPNETEQVFDTNAIERQRHTFAVSLITTLANEARSYEDIELRARVLARSADALWDSDAEDARTLFRRAWEAAQNADAEDTPPPGVSRNATPVMITVQRRIGEGDLRSEVLSLAARRDRTLAEEFLSKFREEKAVQRSDNPEENTNDSWTTLHETSQRLSLAHRLLDENEIEQAFQFALPVLNQVNEKSISFLSRLRLHKPDLADKQFLALLSRAELDPTSDANTVSGLSSYAFTPGLYITFAADGGVRWTPALNGINVPDLPAAVRNQFFRVAATILLRPSPPLPQDRSSAGRSGKYLVIKRLLPLFERYAPDSATALKGQLTALSESLDSFVREDDYLLTQGINKESNSKTVLDQLQDRIDRARTEHERDEIYADATAILASEADPRALDVADRIVNSYRRDMARSYATICLIQFALAKKDAVTAARYGQTDVLSHVQRSWVYAQVARLLMNSDRVRALEILEEALVETRRINAEDEHRVNLMIGIAKQFLIADTVRPWEVAAEAVKAANAIETFRGEEFRLSVPLVTSSGLKMLELDTTQYTLSSFTRVIAREDFTRASDWVKSFKYEAPRAVATLAVASAVLERPVERKK